MTQYLTSSKVCLLVLAAVYCEGFVPPEKAVQVLSLVTSQQLPVQLTPTRNAPSSQDSRPRGIVELQEIKDVLAKLSCARTPQNLWDSYVFILRQISNIDALFDFFTSLKQLFTPRAMEDGSGLLSVSKTSLVGSFVRRSQLEFEKLNFQDVVNLWQSFERFVSPHLTIKKSDEDELEAADHASAGKISTVMGLADEWRASDHLDGKDNSQISSYDAERFLEAQHQRMREFEQRLFSDTKRQFEDLSHPSAQTASASYYVKFLDASLSGDYSTSFEYLHRYYDYDMRLRSGQSFYQFALLSTALLQADLGCYEEAIKALNETVAIARENKDTWCLVFTLHWLYHIQTIVGKDVMESGSKGILESDAKSLTFLKAKAIENKAWSIASATLLREAQLGLSHGRPPFEALEHVHEAASMNVHHRLWSGMRSQNLQQAALYARLGISTLSSSFCTLVMDAAPRGVQEKDKLQARCRNAYAAIVSGDTKTAQKLMADFKPSAHHNLQMQQLAQTFNGLLKLKVSLYQNDLRNADLILNSLSNSPTPDPELRFQIALLKLDYYARVGDFDKAYSLIDSLPSTKGDAIHRGSGAAVRSQGVAQNIQLLLAKAKLFLKFHMPQKGFSIALRATVAAFEAHIIPALWEAVAVLSKILVSIGESEQASALLESVVWPASETADYELMAMLQSAYADAQVSMAGRVKNNRQTREAPLRKALQWAERAYSSFERLDDILGKCEMTAKIAVVLKLLGDEQAAADKVRMFKQMNVHAT